jgi:Tfp pilus assembly protein PilF
MHKVILSSLFVFICVAMAQDTTELKVIKAPQISLNQINHAVAYYNLGVIDFYDKDYEAASMYFTKALALNKKLVEALLMLGRCDLGLNKKKEASSYFKQAYALDKSSADVGLYAAFGLISAGDTAQAESVLVKLKRNAEALKMLGQIESSKGNYAAAATYFSEAISGGALPDLPVWEVTPSISDPVFMPAVEYKEPETRPEK